MLLESDGVGIVITLIKTENKFQYYVVEKEIWILNEEMLKDIYIQKGYRFDESDGREDIRSGFSILSEKNISDFLELAEEFKASKEELKEFYDIYRELYGDMEAHYVVTPIFYIDFDMKEFYSFFTEPGSYELYMPKGWIGYAKDGDYDTYVPVEMKYW